MRRYITMLLALASTATVFAKEFTSAEVTRKINEVKILEKEKSARSAQLKEVLKSHQFLQTGRKSRAELKFPDSSISRLGANTTFSFRDKGRNLQLDEGSMLLQVPKNAGGATIYTNSIVATITGTTVILEYHKNKWIKFISLEGSASITTKRGGKIKLKPGQMVYLKDTGERLTRTVEVDLERLKNTALLLSEKEFGKLPAEAETKFLATIADQQKKIKSGVLRHQKVVAREPGVHLSDKLNDNGVENKIRAFINNPQNPAGNAGGQTLPPVFTN